MENNLKIEWKQVGLPQLLVILKNETPSQTQEECSLDPKVWHCM